MNLPEIDETKLPEVMELIDKAANLIEQKDCKADKSAKHELEDLQKRLRDITGNKKTKISNYQAYWAYTDLETAARTALLHKPQKSNLTDEKLETMIRTIMKVDFKQDIEATINYFFEVLKVETGLDNITDYIYYPQFVGLEAEASEEEIIKKIIADKKSP